MSIPPAAAAPAPVSPPVPPGALRTPKGADAPPSPGAAAEPPAGNYRPATRPRGLRGRLRAFEDWMFPVQPKRRPNPSGILPGWLPESYALVLAVALAGIFAIILEYTASMAPVPPGGDPGEWLTTSYAYVGLPYPSWIIPGQYPPLLFPVLGSLVRLGGSPIEGARLYLGIVSLLIGLSVYALARSLVRSAMLAIVAEGLVLFNPSFLQLFFFGAYPNLFGLAFSTLSIAFGIRFLRSQRSWHAFLFWAFLAAAILSHDLVAAIAVTTLVLMGAFLVWMGRLPRELYRSRGGIAGIALLAVGVGGFYLVTHFLRIPHPDYLQSSAFAYVRGGLGQIFYLLLNPFFPALHPSVSGALFYLVAISSICILAMVGLRVLRPRRLTLSVVTILSMVAAVTVLSLVGWEARIITDYVRFGYFLVIPAIVGFVVLCDWFVNAYQVQALRTAIASGLPGRGPAAPPSEPSEPTRTDAWDGPRLRRRWGRRAVGGFLGRPGAQGAAFMIALAVLFLAAYSYSFARPDLATDETNNTQTAHNQSFLGAISAIRDSGIKGTILTVPGAAKWTRALTAEDAYSPELPVRYTFDPTHIAIEEQTYFAMTDHYAVSNGNVAATLYGSSSAFSDAGPIFQASYYGVFNPILALPISEFHLHLVGPNGTPINETLDSAPVIYAPLAGSQTSMALVYTTPRAVVNITLTAPLGTDEAVASVRAFSTGPALIANLTAKLENAPGGSGHFLSTGCNTNCSSVEMLPGSAGSGLNSYASISPANSFVNVLQYNHVRLGAPAQADISVGGGLGHGQASVAFTLTFSTPTATNLTYKLPSMLDTVTLWQGWNVRWILYGNNSGQAPANFLSNEIQYLMSEFHATIYTTSGTWTLLQVTYPY